jgi:hypothetical protein
MTLLGSRPRLIAGAALLVMACGDVNEAEPPEALQLRSADQALGKIVDEPPRMAVERGGLLPQRPGPFVDWQGRKWNCVGKAKQVVIDQPPHVVPPADVKDELAPRPTVEQLAENMRPVTVLNGFECIGDPDYETARKILEGTDGAKATDGSDKTDKWCCGNDDRNIEGWNFVFDKLILSEVGCTASFIHPSVAITAAHCLYDTVSNAFLTVPNGSGGTWLPEYRDGMQGAPTPQPRANLDCYVISINAGFVNSTSNWNPKNDYAYIDFSTSPGGNCSRPHIRGLRKGIDTGIRS